jgi:iron complex outermembrane recepter protein
MRLATIVAATFFTTGGLLAADGARAAIAHYELNIPRQPLDTALKDLAQQTGLQVGRFSDAVNGAIVVGPVTGNYSADQALKTLLASTRLTYRALNDRAIIVLRSEDTAQFPANGHSANTLSTSGENAAGESSSATSDHKSLWDRLRLAQADLAAPAPPSAAGPTAQLEEIVVTASKRTETLTKAPLAVTAISQQQLTDAGVVSVQDLSAQAPDLSLRQVGYAGSLQITIRGVTNTDPNQSSNPAIATYVDGHYLGSTRGIAGELYDLADVEVLRGPQGTLYGRNSTGGNVNINTADPVSSFRAAIDVSYGNYQDVLTHGMVNIPVSDALAVRLAFVTHYNNGYFDTSSGTNAPNYGKAADYGARFSTLWTPTEDFKWRLVVEEFHSNGTPSLDIAVATDGKPLDGLPVFDRPVPYYPEPPLSRIDNLLAVSRMEWQIGSGLSLTYLAGYQDNDNIQQFATSAPTLEDSFDGYRPYLNINFSQELDLHYDANGMHNILGGSFYHLQNEDGDTYHLYFSDEIFRLYQPDINKTTAWGIFDQASYDVTSRLRFIAGLRYSYEHATNNGEYDSTCPLGNYAPNTSLASLTPAAMTGPGCAYTLNPPTAGTWKDVTWRAGAQYDVSDQTSAYLTVATGFKSGGLNSGIVDPLPVYAPEKITNYELGVKTHLLDNRLNLNTSIFYEDYRNLQVTQAVTANGQTSGVTANAAAARIYGTEIEGQWNLSSRDHLDGFFTYLHATFTNYPGAIDQFYGITYANLAGNYLAYSPEFTARIKYAHDFALPNGGLLTPSAATYWQSVNYLRPFDLPIDRVGAYSKTTLDLSYRDPSGHWKASAYVYNLENNAIRNDAIPVSEYYSSYDPPRTYGVRASYEF